VIWALEPNTIDETSERQAGASVHAQIAPCEELVTGTPDDDNFSEHAGSDRSTIRELVNAGYGMPIIDQTGSSIIASPRTSV